LPVTKPKLKNFAPTRFMRDYWQRRPLFIQEALPADFVALRSADLFKLAARPEVESRIIIRKLVRQHWRYKAADGPFTHQDFEARRHQPNWTLLVQRVNEWLPRVDLLFEYFHFIANWRIDDIMVSYATPGGTVGPHLDNYDVFLCQLKGERTWKFSNRASRSENLEADQPVRLLTDFAADKTVVCRPGDILYLPPRFGHYGVADSECITVSIGFRAPQLERLMGLYFNEMAGAIGDTFYGDAGAPVQKHNGLFSESALMGLTKMAQAGLKQLGATKPAEPLHDAFLRELSNSPNAVIRSQTRMTQAAFLKRWRSEPLQRNPRNQYFYRIHAASVTLYAAGESFALPANQQHLIADLCNHRLFFCTAKRLKPLAAEFWYEMFKLGFVLFAK